MGWGPAVPAGAAGSGRGAYQATAADASGPAGAPPHARPRPHTPKRPRPLPHLASAGRSSLSLPRRLRTQLPSPTDGRRRWCRRGATPPATRRASGAVRPGPAGLPAGTGPGRRAALRLAPARQWAASEGQVEAAWGAGRPGARYLARLAPPCGQRWHLTTGSRLTHAPALRTARGRGAAGAVAAGAGASRGHVGTVLVHTRDEHTPPYAQAA